MYQGETITTTVSGFPIPVSQIEKIYIVFRNSFKTLLEKTLEDCTVDGETLIFRLSQQESLLLGSGDIVRSAVIITKDGTRLESCPSAFKCGRTTKNEVL